MSFSIYASAVPSFEEKLSGPFDASIDEACAEIHNACKGFGTDEEKLNDVLGDKTPTERRQIQIRYKEKFDKSLHDLVDSETSGNYGKLLQLLCLPTDEAEAFIIRSATKGAGTTEKLLYPILCGRSTAEVEILKKAFFHRYDKDLVSTLDGELSGDLKKFIMTSLQELAQTFDPEVHTQQRAEEIADEIYDAGQGKWGTDEKTFFRSLCSTPPELLKQVDAIYLQKRGNNLMKAIKKEFGGKTEDALLHWLGMNLDPIGTIAALLESTMKGIGTDEFGLTAAVVRYQHVMPQVKEAYEKQYGKTLRDRIHGETSGKYRDLLIRLVQQ